MFINFQCKREFFQVRNNRLTKSYLHAFTNCPDVKRHGYAANFVAMTMLSLSAFDPRNKEKKEYNQLMWGKKNN